MAVPPTNDPFTHKHHHMRRLENQVAIITGGAGAIGKTTAALFAAEGAKVLLVDMNEEALKEAVAEIDHPEVSYALTDVTRGDDVQAMAQTARDRYGRIDMLFANAGVEGAVKPIIEYPEKTFDQVMAVNVKGVWLCLKYVMPVMAETGGGSIVITSSVAGLQGTPGVSGYVTSKHALVGLMKTAALEGGDMGIRVNSIHPAPVDNRMMRSLEEGFAPGQGDSVKSSFEQQIPLKRYAENQDVAKLVLFLASGESAYISGGQYTVDGAMTASG